MSSIDAALRAKLVATSGVTTLVSTRIYPDELPQGSALPAIRYSLISDVPDRHVPGFREARVQVSVYDDDPTPTDANTVAEAVISAISRTELQMEPASWTAGATAFTVITCRAVNGPRLREPDTRYWHYPVDFLIKYRM
jgi:hypothetical protein